MHELAICQALMAQLEQAAASHQATTIERVVLAVGALSGVEPQLLQRAFEIARAGTVAATAVLEIQTGPARVSCRTCGAKSTVATHRLLCAACGDWRVTVIAGEELLLVSLDLCTQPDGAEPVLQAVQRQTGMTESTQGKSSCVTPVVVQ
jgi:hydrogenase nickel incorporation protein HypA/HybF